MRPHVAPTIALLAALLANSTASGQAPDVDLDRQADAVIEAFEALPPSAAGFDAWINDDDAAILAVGQPIAIRMRSDRPAYTTLVYLDQDAVISLPIRSDLASATRLPEPGAYVVSCDGVIPGSDPGADCGFEAFFPLGFDLLWVIATPEPIDLRALGGRWDVADGLERLRPQDGPVFARALVAHLRELPAGTVAWERLEQAVLELGEGNPDFLAEYVRNRALRNPTSNQRYRVPSIFFASNSAQLDARARRSLDLVANALQRPDNANARVRLTGHADAVGPASANEALSARRAEATRAYLEQQGVAASRIEVGSSGERSPLSPGASDVALKRNRRVEVEILP